MRSIMASSVPLRPLTPANVGRLPRARAHQQRDRHSLRGVQKNWSGGVYRCTERRAASRSGSGLQCSAVSLPDAPGPQKRLKQLGQTPKHALGQNLLLAEVVEDTIKAADIQPGDEVLEIGPGTGVLTRGLLLAGANVTAIEKDTGLAAGLAEQYADVPGFTVINEDFMRWRKKEPVLLPHLADKGTRVKVVAKLPYNITSDALKRLLPMGDTISDLVLMVQFETAERLISSSAGDGDYRPISVRVHYYSEPTFYRKVPKEVYYPAPAVDGAIVGFKLLTSQQIPQIDNVEFFKFVGAAFSSKRKMVRNNLQAVGFKPNAVTDALEQMGLQPTERPNQLTWQQYIELQKVLQANAVAGSNA